MPITSPASSSTRSAAITARTTSPSRSTNKSARGWSSTAAPRTHRSRPRFQISRRAWRGWTSAASAPSSSRVGWTSPPTTSQSKTREVVHAPPKRNARCSASKRIRAAFTVPPRFRAAPARRGRRARVRGQDARHARGADRRRHRRHGARPRIARSVLASRDGPRRFDHHPPG